MIVRLCLCDCMILFAILYSFNKLHIYKQFIGIQAAGWQRHLPGMFNNLDFGSSLGKCFLVQELWDQRINSTANIHYTHPLTNILVTCVSWLDHQSADHTIHGLKTLHLHNYQTQDLGFGLLYTNETISKQDQNCSRTQISISPLK